MWLTTHPEEDDVEEDDSQAYAPQGTQHLRATFRRCECSDKKRQQNALIRLNRMRTIQNLIKSNDKSVFQSRIFESK